MAEYVDKKHIYDLFEGTNGIVRLHVAEVDNLPAADVAPVVPELRKVVELLHEEYERSKKLDFVYDPLAYAVYQVWKAVDGRRKNGR